MSVRVEFRKRGTVDTVELEYTPGMTLPQARDRIVSHFNPERIVTVLEVICDTPRDCFQVFVSE